MNLHDVSRQKALVERVASSVPFATAPKLRAFFLYVVDCSLRGQPEEATEQQIGIHIFGRSAGYNTGDDSVVRSQARLLRIKLAYYFEAEGKQEPAIIEMPKGHYLPIFVDRVKASSEPRTTLPGDAGDPAPDPLSGLARELNVAPGLPGPLTGNHATVLPALNTQHDLPLAPASAAGLRMPRGLRQTTVALMLVLAGFVAGAGAWHRWSTAEERQADVLWSRFFLKVPPTLVIYSNPLFRGTPATGLKLVDPGVAHADPEIDDETYTGTGEVAAIRQLTRLFDAHRSDFVLKRSRLVTWDQARSSNLVFVGAPSQNTALQDLPALSQFSIVIDSEGHGVIANRHPLPGEPATFAPNDKTQETAIVALVPGVEARTNILVISGLTTIGTQTAVEYLCRPENVLALAGQAGVTGGELRPFEAVLQIGISHGVGINAKLILLHGH